MVASRFRSGNMQCVLSLREALVPAIFVISEYVNDMRHFGRSCRFHTIFNAQQPAALSLDEISSLTVFD